LTDMKKKLKGKTVTMKSKKLQLYKTIELNKNAPSWTKKVPNGFLVNLFTLFVKFMYRTIPTKSGAHGVGEDVSVTVPEYLMIDFIKHFIKLNQSTRNQKNQLKAFLLQVKSIYK
jgi:hypothetical protein